MGGKYPLWIVQVLIILLWGNRIVMGGPSGGVYIGLSTPQYEPAFLCSSERRLHNPDYSEIRGSFSSRSRSQRTPTSTFRFYVKNLRGPHRQDP
jgi:hypothetical protein